jgi:hypothetical protein
MKTHLLTINRYLVSMMIDLNADNEDQECGEENFFKIGGCIPPPPPRIL